jgi:hypothetical protein
MCEVTGSAYGAHRGILFAVLYVRTAVRNRIVRVRYSEQRGTRFMRALRTTNFGRGFYAFGLSSTAVYSCAHAKTAAVIF